MGVIATLLPAATHLQRIRTALRDRHAVMAVTDWPSLIEACVEHPVRVAVVDLFTGANGQAAFESVRMLKQRSRRLTIVAYVTFADDRVHDLFDAGRQGIDALVLADRDDSPRSLLALLDRAESRNLSALLRQSLDGVDDAVRDAVLLSVTRAHERIGPEKLARLLALPRRSVSERLARAGFPAPQQVLSWGRLIVAAHLLEDDHRSADGVAATLDFPSGSAFRNSCQRYLGAAPGEIRERGGSVFVINRFLAEVGRPPL